MNLKILFITLLLFLAGWYILGFGSDYRTTNNFEDNKSQHDELKANEVNLNLPTKNPEIKTTTLLAELKNSGIFAEEKVSPSQEDIAVEDSEMGLNLETVGPVKKDIQNIKKSKKTSLSDDARDLFKPLVNNKNAEPVQNNNSNYIAGISSGSSYSAPAAKASSTPIPSNIPGLPWVFGQARGYTMLYAMQREARPVVEKQISNLLDSRLREIYIAVLIDGTFGEDFDYLKSIISRLSSSERYLTVALYATNGPTMRVWDSTPIHTDFSNIEPVQFRSKIKWDNRTRAIYKEILERAKEIFEFNKAKSPNNKNIIYPMLEDNLDRSSFFVMRDLTSSVIGNLATIMRNPCEGCYEGNDSDALDGNIEEHPINNFYALEQLDSFSYDGQGFNYPNENNSSKISFARAKELMNLGLQKGLNTIGLWQFKWQGVTKGKASPHPNDRNYQASTEEELEYEIELLREGLSLDYGDKR